jgi:hypothetical protein
MKKLLLFIAFISLLSANAQENIKQDPTGKLGVATVPLQVTTDTPTVTWSKVYNDVKGALNGLASGLKVGTEHVYAVLIKQQLVSSIVYLITLIISIIVSIFLVKYIKALVKTAEDAYDDFGYYFLCILFGIIILIMFIISICHMESMITGFINPEYGAIKEIIDKIK